MSGPIEDGRGQGYLAAVDPEGNLEVSTRPGACSIERSSVSVATTSGRLLAAREGRTGLRVQNQGANPVYLRFGAAAATNADWLVGAGAEFVAEDFAYGGEIRGIAVGGTSVVLVLEKVA